MGVTLQTAASGLEPPVLFVDADGQYGPGCAGTESSAFATIQEAVDAAVVNRTKIRVCPGTYEGSVNIDNDVNGLSLRPVAPRTVTLSPGSAHVAHADLITIHGVTGTELAGFNIVVPTDSTCPDVNILIRVQNAPYTSLLSNHVLATGARTLSNCGYAMGIYLRNSARSLIAWNHVDEFWYRGISVSRSNRVRVRANTVRFEHPTAGAVGQGLGIVVSESLRARVRDNIVSSPSSAGDTTPFLLGGITILYADETRVIDNRVGWTQRGMQTVASNTLTITGNRVRHASLVGLRLQTNASTIQNNSAKSGNDMGIEVYKTSQTNQIIGNDFRNNAGTDCIDQSTGPANTWTSNLGDDSSPEGLCSTL
jgi:parallel beta-helix repeat protein